MKYAHTCWHCQQLSLIGETDLQPLSERDKALWAKTRRDHNQVGDLQGYRKVVCPNCNGSALVDATKLRPV